MDEVAVLRSDLESLQGLLSTVLNQHMAQDLVEQYRKLDNRNRRSPLTIAINDGLSKVEAYIAAADDEDEDDDD